MSKLIRDDDTGALINTDDSAYENYVNNRPREKEREIDKKQKRSR